MGYYIPVSEHIANDVGLTRQEIMASRKEPTKPIIRPLIERLIAAPKIHYVKAAAVVLAAAGVPASANGAANKAPQRSINPHAFAACLSGCLPRLVQNKPVPAIISPETPPRTSPPTAKKNTLRLPTPVLSTAKSPAAMASPTTTLSQPALPASPPPSPSLNPNVATPPPTLGVDISWPNCWYDTKSTAVFGIVGLNDGTPFTKNPCSAQEAADFANPAYYVNTNNPGTAAEIAYQGSPNVCMPGINYANCLAYDYGYSAGVNASNAVLAEGFNGEFWLDAEIGSNGNVWQLGTTADIIANRNDLQGELGGITHEAAIYGRDISEGIYSTPDNYPTIFGNWPTDEDQWLATGQTSLGAAQADCSGPGFGDGGKVVAVQYQPTPELDNDSLC